MHIFLGIEIGNESWIPGVLIVCIAGLHLWLSIFDLDQFRLPDALVFSLWCVTVSYVVVVNPLHCATLVAVSVTLSALVCATSITAPNHLGLGDAKLIGALVLLVLTAGLSALAAMCICICIFTTGSSIWAGYLRVTAFPLAPSLVLASWSALALG